MIDLRWFFIAVLLLGLPMAGPPVMEGKASWYGDPYTGRLMQNGKIYTAADMTCAVPYERWGDLEGRMLIVCDLDTCILVRATDTMPGGGVVDLSPPAFRKLVGPLGLGIARVRVWTAPSRQED